MQKRRLKKSDKLLNKLDKFVKKDYNNELEIVLEKKMFDEHVKSILLSILYKLETAYKDYEIVKPNAESKEEFVERLIDIIKNDCDDIKFVKMNSKNSSILGDKTFLVDKKSKRIICYPIERKLLYCIAKVGKKDRIIKDKYPVVDRTLSDLINVGNNIDMVEPMRDFNGYSWTTIPREIESRYHNIVYQNIRILVGQRFLNKWVKNEQFIIDYFDSFKNILEERYGAKEKDEFIEILGKISVLLAVRYNKKLANILAKDKNEVERRLEKISDNKEFVKEATREKRELTKQIKHIDEVLNNKNMLKDEYEKRNELLPLEEKIFSIRILSKIMIQERDELIEKIEKLNNVLIPKKFVNLKEKLRKKNDLLQLLDTKDVDGDILKQLLKLQKQFLKCYAKKISKIDNKQDLIKVFYEFRYYCLLPIDDTLTVGTEESLAKSIEKIQVLLIEKAKKLKLIDAFALNKDVEYNILKNIFYTRIIKLEDLHIKLTKEKDNRYFIQLFDEDIFEEKIELSDIQELNKKDLLIKPNKKTKVFD